MENLKPQEIEILNEFQSRLIQSKKTKELLQLSPTAYIDKRIGEIIASQTNQSGQLQISDDLNNKTKSFEVQNNFDDKNKINEVKNQDSFYDGPIFKSTQKNRLIVPSIKSFETNKNLKFDECNKENKETLLFSRIALDEKKRSIPKEKMNKSESVKKKNGNLSESKKQNEKTMHIHKIEEPKKKCNKKLKFQLF